MAFDHRHHLRHAELSDFVIDYAPDTGERRPVLVEAVVEQLRAAGLRRSARIASRLPRRGRYFDEAGVDAILLRSHLELQRLAEEIRLGQRATALLKALKRALELDRFVLVDVGCGLGYLIRHLAESGVLGADTELIGVDYNARLIDAAQRLAEAENLPCRFVTGNAFELDVDASVFMSSGVVHHFGTDELADFFAHQHRAGARAVMHFDIAPTALTPLGAWVFHWARMREPLARHDGVRSALRAHTDADLVDGLRRGVPDWTPLVFDATAARPAILNVMRPVFGMAPEHAERFRNELGTLADRLTINPSS